MSHLFSTHLPQVLYTSNLWIQKLKQLDLGHPNTNLYNGKTLHWQNADWENTSSSLCF